MGCFCWIILVIFKVNITKSRSIMIMNQTCIAMCSASAWRTCCTFNCKCSLASQITFASLLLAGRVFLHGLPSVKKSQHYHTHNVDSSAEPSKTRGFIWWSSSTFTLSHTFGKKLLATKRWHDLFEYPNCIADTNHNWFTDSQLPAMHCGRKFTN